MRALLVVLAACGASATPPTPPTPPTPSVAPVASAPKPFTDAVITGRVVLDGTHVEEFGIQQRALPVRRVHPVLSVSQPNGRFEVHLEPGTWDLVIAGRGFAVTVLRDKQLEPGKVIDLGDIAPRKGFTITGEVTDRRAQAVPDAIVSIQQSPAAPVDDSLTALTFGNFLVRTDARGRYRLDGVVLLDPSRTLQIRAVLRGKGASLPERIAVGNITKNIVLQEVGVLHAFAATATRGSAFVMPASRWGLVFADRVGDSYRFDDLPVGTYSLSAGGTGVPVTIVAGQTTTVTLP